MSVYSVHTTLSVCSVLISCKWAKALSPNPAVKAKTNVLEQAGSSSNLTCHLTLERFTPSVQVRLDMHLRSPSLRLDVPTGCECLKSRGGLTWEADPLP